MRSAYDPFNREEERELEQLAAAREEHQLWSLEQARRGRSADQRENTGVWQSLAPLPAAPTTEPRN